MKPLHTLVLALALSVIANAWLASRWLASRDAATLAAEQRDRAQGDATACSDATEALRERADVLARQARAAQAAARLKAMPLQQRADATLAAPPSVPGDDCRSASERGRRWLAERARP